jgi:P4 family phage/plasmid primase-like protien
MESSNNKSNQKSEKQIARHTSIPKMPKEFISFKNFMERNRITKEGEEEWEVTHTSMSATYKGKFHISDENYDDFLVLYSKAVESGVSLSIVERHKEYSPVIIDVDMKYNMKDNQRIYTNELINKIVKFYLEQFVKYFELTDDCQYQAYITEKKMPTITEYLDDEVELKDGFHIHFPYINTKPAIQYLIRRELLNKATEEEWFDKYNLVNTLDDVFDKKVIEDNGLLIYGSRKTNGNPYILTRCYNGEENLDISHFDFDATLRLLSLRSAGDDDITVFKEEYDDDMIYNICIEEGIIRKTKEGKDIDMPDKDNNDEIVKARDLVKMLSKDRASNFETWVNVGFCLYNINKSLLDEWIQFSQKCGKKFKHGECEKKWNNEFKYRLYGFGIGSLIMWAKEDSPELYKKFRYKELRAILDDASGGEPSIIAKYIKNKYGDKFVCASIGKNIWYEFKQHRWKQIDSGHSLKTLLHTEVVDDYLKLASDYSNMAAGNVESLDKEKLAEKSQNILKTAKSLKRMPRINEIMEFLKMEFYDEDFLKNIDENKNLLGFKNGVLDLNSMQFRDGMPEDLITLSTDINYKPLMQEDPRIKEINNVLIDMLPDKDMRIYVFRLLASCLDGMADQKFHIWTGSGGNGKSILVDFFLLCLGQYAETVDATMITRNKGSSSSASPDKLKLKGRRFAVMNEPEGDDTVRVGHMKELTGGDKINARALFDNNIISFTPQFKLFLLCNKKPVIPSSDGGTWRRIRVVPFEMKFVDNPKGPNERKIDRSLKQKLFSYAEVFMSMLVEEYKKYKIEGLTAPDKVTLSTNLYQQASDTLEEFMKDCIEKIPDSPNNSKISVSAIYDEYKRWIKQHYNGERKAPNKTDFKGEIENKLGVSNGKGWTNIRWCCEETTISNMIQGRIDT